MGMFVLLCCLSSIFFTHCLIKGDSFWETESCQKAILKSAQTRQTDTGRRACGEIADIDERLRNGDVCRMSLSDFSPPPELMRCLAAHMRQHEECLHTSEQTLQNFHDIVEKAKRMVTKCDHTQHDEIPPPNKYIEGCYQTLLMIGHGEAWSNMMRECSVDSNIQQVPVGACRFKKSATSWNVTIRCMHNTLQRYDKCWNVFEREMEGMRSKFHRAVGIMEGCLLKS